ncbi:adenosylcobinamide-phosphate synthase CbiB [Noviherbaspirillum denitrificans]|uniref:Cobalamin biosynthesis protein CobD n=1 Tax=Noviherbaspirillum denitrificans TaxID=1968433 RepID=A0A254TB08_9BURK|nr:adenosylcobinamide-phosphate synthase CbiB [Noviherbaspirillum denitrificans]OWW19840.1 adenosylcobinamide-phosphate synthase [Noviherbaspirillum denitrificans]
MLTALLMAAGVGIDWVLGEPRKWHPLVGFGRFANAIERRLNRGAGRTGKGIAAWMIAVLPLTALAAWACAFGAEVNTMAGWAIHAVLLYFCIGLRSLRDHLLPIAQALRDGNLVQARELTSRIVSRDTRRSNEPELAKAAVESLLENGNDAVFGTLFWFAVAGGPGAVLFRLANTLDAMWGYRNERFNDFGWMAARTDDVLNWIPARLTALSYAILGDTRCAWACWQSQAASWGSPNAGPVMSAGAGALHVSLGGAAEYDGEIEERPLLGKGSPASAEDIGRAWSLVARTCILWLVVIAAAGFFIERISHA